jgi:hypothetical protein
VAADNEADNNEADNNEADNNEADNEANNEANNEADIPADPRIDDIAAASMLGISVGPSVGPLGLAVGAPPVARQRPANRQGAYHALLPADRPIVTTAYRRIEVDTRNSNDLTTVGARWTHAFCDYYVPGAQSMFWLKDKIDLVARMYGMQGIHGRLCSMNRTRNLLQHRTKYGVFFLEEGPHKQYLDEFTYVLDYTCPNHQLIHTNPEAEEVQQAFSNFQRTTMEREAVFQAHIQQLTKESNSMNWHKADAAFHKAQNALLRGAGAKRPSADNTEGDTEGRDDASAKRQRH